MLKIIIVAGWGLFAIDAFLAVVALISRNLGNDAAGRGVAFTFGLIGLAFVFAGGAGLYFSGRFHSWLGAAASILPLALPLLLFFGSDIESYAQRVASVFHRQKAGRFPDPAQRELFNAIENDDCEAIRKILAARPNLGARDEAGSDLLSYAVTQTHLARSDEENVKSVEGVRLLVDAGADPNPPFIESAYHVSRPMPDGWAADPAGAEVFRLLLEHGANPNVLKEKQPLIFDIWTNPDSMRAMLDHGADINARDENGDTPLLFYLWNGRWDAAMLVLERGADVSVQNKLGTTPQLALANGKRIADEIMKKPLPAAYERVAAALNRSTR